MVQLVTKSSCSSIIRDGVLRVLKCSFIWGLNPVVQHRELVCERVLLSLTPGFSGVVGPLF